MSLANKLKALAQYSACDRCAVVTYVGNVRAKQISDALLRLKVPGAGFLADLGYIAPAGVSSEHISSQPKVLSPASTVLFVSKTGNPEDDSAAFQGVKESNIPAGTHFVDHTKKDTFVVMSQPQSHSCACLGGILAQRMKVRGANGILVDGRVRDLAELKSLQLPIWSRATSTVGSGLEAKPWALDVPITIRGLTIKPGDIIFSDPAEGIVSIPQEKLDEVIELVPKLVEADDKVKEDVLAGSTVKEAFAKHRR